MPKGRKQHELPAQVLAMRILLDVQQHAKRHPDFFLAELAAKLSAKYTISRAQACRLTWCAMDVLCLPYVPWMERRRRFGELLANRKAEARGRRQVVRGAYVA
ncbi:hypothetical protein [Dyella sp.]|jgi:hypothetical protein|uniref:hypothetical protein n=1 Tax=Dyella sp. TaxID=1869338 RepID=UPI002FD89C87